VLQWAQQLDAALHALPPVTKFFTYLTISLLAGAHSTDGPAALACWLHPHI
jgi:hypothetical protein